MSEPTVLDNIRQVYIYLREECGYKCSYGKVRDAVEKHRTLTPRRGGGFSRGTVDAWARAHLVKLVDPSPDADRPTIPSPTDTPLLPGAAEKKIEAQAQYLGLKLSKEQFEFAERRGLYVETAIIERELADRAVTMRHMLEGYFREAAAEVISLLGGNIERARRLAEIVGGDPDRADDLSQAQYALQPELIARTQLRLRDALNCYAAGNWYTEEFASLWDRYRATTEAAAAETMRELIEYVGGDADMTQAALARFAIARRGVE